jgi:YgiT-type zinc finger domain-containing protein
MTKHNNECPLCGGIKVSDKTAFTVDLGFGVIVVRNVPATVCSLCGEEWFNDKVSEKLEKIVQNAKRKHCMVEIADWKYEARECSWR